jgi:hypothetical protein
MYENAWDNREKESKKTLVYYQGFLARRIFFFPFLPPFIAAFHAGTFI